MNNPKTVVLSILMYFVGVSHMIIGLAILVSPQLQQSVAAIYGAQELDT